MAGETGTEKSTESLGIYSAASQSSGANLLEQDIVSLCGFRPPKLQGDLRDLASAARLR